MIEQGKGTLAASESVTTAEAFELLRDTARSSGRKLVEVARADATELDER